MHQTYRINPTVPRGYVLNDARGAIGVVVPEATINQCKNPSVEINTTGWFGNGANMARTISTGRRGIYGLVVTPLTNTGSRGVGYGESGLISGEPCTVSVDLFGAAGRIYNLIVSHGGTSVTQEFIGHGIWQREALTIAALTATSIIIEINLVSLGMQDFYVDGLQIEQKHYATTYTDGDMVGFVRNQSDFYWTGLPHVSTSARTAQTRAGGKVIMLDSIGWKILSMIGLSMSPVSVLSQPLATGGGYYQTTLPQERVFSLIGDVYGTTELDLQRRKDELIDAMNPFTTSVRQPMVLTYQEFDQDGRLPHSEACEIVCHYTGGMEGLKDNNYQERIAGEFRMFLPTILKSGDMGAILTAQEQLPGGGTANYILQRTPDGGWQTVPNGLGPGANSVVHTILHIGGGQYYVGGAFTSVGGGIANTSRIARWDGTTWNALGTGALNGAVLAMALAPNGDVVVAGTFTQMGGVANTSRIARWDGTAWSALGSGLDNQVLALAFGTDGSKLYAGGDFLNSGATPMARIAVYDVATNAWSAMGAGANATVYAIHRRTFGEVYIGGNFTSIGGVAANRIAVYNGSVFAAMGGGSSNNVYSITSSPGGLIYVGGEFTSIGGVAANRIASWNGTTWSALGLGFNDAVSELYIDQQGLLYAGGLFATAGGLTLPDGAAVWNGSSWLPLDVDLAGTATVNAFATEPNGTLMIGFNTNNADEIAALTTITTGGNTDAYPTITIVGPTSGTARLWQIINETTGDALYFDLTMGTLEVLTLTLDPTNISFVSNFRGNIIGTIIPASNVSTWHLQAGANRINVFAGDSSVTLSIRWRENYLAIENAVVR